MSADLFQRLAKVGEQLGFTVELGEPSDTGSPTADGGTNFASHRIVIDKRAAPDRQPAILAHELGHAVLHGPGRTWLPEAMLEVEAESISFGVMSALGINDDEEAMKYLAFKSGGDLQGLTEVIKMLTPRIQYALYKILDSMGELNNGKNKG